ncbi:MAG: NTP transferase domain-containing protein, partial [Chloroflexi bacterium]|nr:NTP transferase domain-containing protein [Chloroflexota bacterium]
MTIASVVLAAGMGTRMKSRIPKMMHQVLGKPIVLHALSSV